MQGFMVGPRSAEAAVHATASGAILMAVTWCQGAKGGRESTAVQWAGGRLRDAHSRAGKNGGRDSGGHEDSA